MARFNYGALTASRKRVQNGLGRLGAPQSNMTPRMSGSGDTLWFSGLSAGKYFDAGWWISHLVCVALSTPGGRSAWPWETELAAGRQEDHKQASLRCKACLHFRRNWCAHRLSPGRGFWAFLLAVLSLWTLTHWQRVLSSGGACWGQCQLKVVSRLAVHGLPWDMCVFSGKESRAFIIIYPEDFSPQNAGLLKWLVEEDSGWIECHMLFNYCVHYCAPGPVCLVTKARTNWLIHVFRELRSVRSHCKQLLLIIIMIMVGVFKVFTDVGQPWALWGRYCYYACFADLETELQKGEMIGQGQLSSGWARIWI